MQCCVGDMMHVNLFCKYFSNVLGSKNVPEVCRLSECLLKWCAWEYKIFSSKVCVSVLFANF